MRAEMLISVMHCRYAKLSAEEIRLDRYAKFRKLGQYEEFLVQGGQWRDAREQRAQVRHLSMAASKLMQNAIALCPSTTPVCLG